METAIIIGMGIIVVAYGAWVTYEQKRKNDKIFRELERIRYQSQISITFIEQAKITPYGPKDRNDYLDLAVQSALDAQNIAVKLSEEL